MSLTSVTGQLQQMYRTCSRDKGRKVDYKHLLALFNHVLQLLINLLFWARDLVPSLMAAGLHGGLGGLGGLGEGGEGGEGEGGKSGAEKRAARKQRNRSSRAAAVLMPSPSGAAGCGACGDACSAAAATPPRLEAPAAASSRSAWPAGTHTPSALHAVVAGRLAETVTHGGGLAGPREALAERARRRALERGAAAAD